jgi:glycosyltransferase involved in cell wall biosynthesis
VRLVGQRPYADLPRYLQRFDVCLNPYRNDAVAEGASPLKLYEYLASGKPVVSSDMPEARRFADVVSIAHTPDEFITAIGRALAENGSRRRQRQLVIARDNGWEKRFEELERQLEPVLMKRPERTSCLG